MIQCVPNTVLPVDEAVINHLPYSYASPIKLDTDFLAMLTQFHGGTTFDLGPSGSNCIAHSSAHIPLPNLHNPRIMVDAGLGLPFISGYCLMKKVAPLPCLLI